jgi:hypothetical protein
MDVKGARILAERIALNGRRQEAAASRPGSRLRCSDCGGPIAPILVRLGSVSCHDCRTGKHPR